MFSVVLQGPIDKNVIKTAAHAKKYSCDVIVSTWHNDDQKDIITELHENGVRVVLSNDPGSHVTSYRFDGISKFLNLDRHVLGSLSALKVCEYNVVIRTRVDVTADFQRIFNLWKNSGKKFGAANITTICPFRLLSPTLYGHVSDWLYIGRKDDIISAYSSICKEKYFDVGGSSRRVINTRYFVPYSTEQIIASHFAFGELNPYLEIGGENKFQKEYIVSAHNQLIKNFLNLHRDDIDLSSDKYRGLSGRWTTYRDPEFKDNRYLGGSVKDFVLYLLKQLVVFLKNG